MTGIQDVYIVKKNYIGYTQEAHSLFNNIHPEESECQADAVAKWLRYILLDQGSSTCGLLVGSQWPARTIRCLGP
jgi:hypothetical protein